MIKTILSLVLLTAGVHAWADQQTPIPEPEKVSFKTLAAVIRCASDKNETNDCTTKSSKVNAIEMELNTNKDSNGDVFYTASYRFGVASDDYIFRSTMYITKMLINDGWQYSVDVISETVDKNQHSEMNTLGTVYLKDLNNLNTINLYSPIKFSRGVELQPMVIIGSKDADLDQQEQLLTKRFALLRHL